MSGGFRNGFTMQPHAFDVKLNRLADELPRFFQRPARRDTTWKVRNVRTVASAGWFKEHGVLVHFSPACFSMIVLPTIATRGGGMGVRQICEWKLLSATLRGCAHRC